MCKSANCKNSEVLQEKVKYSFKTTSKISLGTANLNVILGSQNCVFNKANIGYQFGSHRKQKKFNNFFKYSKR